MRPHEKPIGVLVLGGQVGDEETASALRKRKSRCVELGKQLGKAGRFGLVLCSAHKSAADPFVLEGFCAEAQGKDRRIVAHRPLDTRSSAAKKKTGGSIEAQWRRLLTQTRANRRVRRRMHPVADIGKHGFATAFQLCQLRALYEDTDVVVVLGGKETGTGDVSVAVARQHVPVVPFACLQGLGQLEFERSEAELQRTIGPELVDALVDPKGIRKVVTLVDAVRRASGARRVFMSYPWKRAPEADFVEAYLRRPRENTRPVQLFRDEDGISEGQPVQQSIHREIESCDVLLMLWCREYAASAYCLDEFRAAQEHRVPFHVLRLDDTEPVWPELRLAGTHQWDAKWTEAYDPRDPLDPKARRKELKARLDEFRTLR